MLTGLILLLLSSCAKDQSISKEDFLRDLKKRTFDFFWDTKDTTTGQVPDRYPTKNFTSIAGSGFGLTSYIVGIENNYITREQGAKEVEKVLSWLWNSAQGPEASGNTGYQGFYYHFLTYNDGVRFKDVELSTIDTGLLMAGILACQSYFTSDDPREKNIRELADSLFLRVNWNWAMNGKENMSMGWLPESGFIAANWEGYNEAMLLIILGLGSPTYTLPDSAWSSWCRTYVWAEFQGEEHLNFTPLFGHQFSHIFIDFRGIQDSYLTQKGIDYFENSRRGTLSNRNYCIANPRGYEGYSKNIWGLSACDGPADTVINDTLQFHTYWARGASAMYIADDGTITPTAAGGSIPFAPEECIEALYTMRKTYGDMLYQKYGFKDAFNLSYTVPGSSVKGWFDNDYLGLDQGPIILQLENYQTGLIWNIMKKNKYFVNGLRRAGFKGGWLENRPS